MKTRCFALLDDAGAGLNSSASGSRLYTGHTHTLLCHDRASWLQLLEQMQQALQRGQHAVCLCAYELGSHLLPASKDIKHDIKCDVKRGVKHAAPLAQILLFEQCRHLSASAVSDWLEAQAESETACGTPAGVAGIEPSITEARFTQDLASIHAYIEAGDAYQVNYTYRLRFDAFGSLPALYRRLRARQPVPYGALIALDDGSALMSLSPELFVRHARGTLTAQPMKGTAPAVVIDHAGMDANPDANPDANSEASAEGSAEAAAENAQRAAALAQDPKNRAENLMIVDLLRNDIGRIAVTGSVQAPALFQVERYSSVLQMTSTVQARLRSDATLEQIFAALYPCGSITGAPKRRAMEIIEELEMAARGIYTGAIGWFEPATGAHSIGDFCLSVPIRTLALQAEQNGVRKGEMGVGAGIVFDSVASDEYAECGLKARFLTGLPNHFELFETLHASNGELRHLERHLQRLARSCHYFGFAFDATLVRRQLLDACAGIAAPQRVRLSVNQAGLCTIQCAPLLPLSGPVTLLLASEPSDAGDLFLRHKSSVRERYDQAWRAAEAQGSFDSLFFNQRGELTEGGRSNVFVKVAGRWITPPLSSGVLPGVMRGVLLDDAAWDAREQIVTPDMLHAAQEIVVCNALQEVLRAKLLS